MARSYDLTDEKQTKEYLRDVEIEYQFQCLDQKEADGCHRLAEFRENVKKNITAAAPLYKENCDSNKYPKSCYKYGQCLITGKGIPDNKPDLISALQYYEKACDYGLGSGCFNAAQLRLSGTGDNQSNSEKAMSLLDKACELNDGEACFKLSTFYLMGQRVEKDLSKAFQLAKKGCELGSVYSCSNLGLMYRHGNGTEKNAKLANEAKQRAMKLYEETRKKQPTVKVNE
ncbi:cytochrome c oxidase assembly factor 7 homolog [Aplysia californica]|uniref:Cytochrome c oxidase assembly factor 7 homolog n=1 Tax=Aplysia californica TaxID=6500 RepID=A0ABM0JZ36_APLCA|nr:cytochrome c oxidase assembly factor 7 homolog [Aplysia californica]